MNFIEHGLEMVFAPRWQLLDDTLATATAVGLGATARMGLLLGMEGVEQECEALALRLSALREAREKA